MAVRNTKTRKTISMLTRDWVIIEKEARRRGLSKSKLIEFSLREMKVLK